MTEIAYSIPNISCDHCVHTIQIEVAELEGVQFVKANADTRQAAIVFRPPANEAQIKELLAKINYPAAE